MSINHDHIKKGEAMMSKALIHGNTYANNEHKMRLAMSLIAITIAILSISACGQSGISDDILLAGYDDSGNLSILPFRPTFGSMISELKKNGEVMIEKEEKMVTVQYVSKKTGGTMEVLFEKERLDEGDFLIVESGSYTKDKTDSSPSKMNSVFAKDILIGMLSP